MNEIVKEEYYTKHEVYEKFKELNTQFTHQKTFNEFQYENKAILGKLSSNSNDQQKKIKKLEKESLDLQKKMKTKFEESEGAKIWEEFEKYCRFQDLKDLYGKIVPEMKKFEDNMIEMSKEYEQSKEIIRRYDEVLMEKASKTAIKGIHENFKEYLESKKFKKFEQENSEKLQ